MSTPTADPGSPIYQQLVHEHGDVVAEARAQADEAQRQAGEYLSWDGFGAGAPQHRPA